MKKISRRIALKQSLAAAAAFSLPTIVPSRVLGLKGKHSGPNSRINIGLVGNGKIMHGHRNYHIGADDVQVVALSDVKTWELERAQAEVKNLQGEACPTYESYEDMLARDDIDAVVVGTPDHWHA